MIFMKRLFVVKMCSDAPFQQDTVEAEPCCCCCNCSWDLQTVESPTAETLDSNPS